MNERLAIKRIRIEYRRDLQPTEISVDPEVEGCYIRIDLDDAGHVLGVEVLGPVKQVNGDAVGEKYVSEADVHLRAKLRAAAEYARSV